MEDWEAELALGEVLSEALVGRVVSARQVDVVVAYLTKGNFQTNAPKKSVPGFLFKNDG